MIAQTNELVNHKSGTKFTLNAKKESPGGLSFHWFAYLEYMSLSLSRCS